MLASTVVQLTPSVWRQYFCDGKIVAFKVLDARRSTIDVWVTACAAEMFDCVRENRRLRILQDLSSPDFAQTPYSSQRGGELTSGFEELHGRIAMLVQRSPEALRVRGFLRRVADQSTRQRDVFTDPAQALRWLMEDLPPAQRPGPVPLLWAEPDEQAL